MSTDYMDCPFIDKMKLPFLLVCVIFFTSCAPPTPEELAKNSCDCYTKVKSIQNSDNKIEAVNNCYNKVQIDKEALREIEQNSDMNDEQVKRYEARYDKIYSQCK